MPEPTLYIAFLAGVVAFFSPCILPLLPAFLAYLAGVSSEEVKQHSVNARAKIFTNTLCFVLGFTLVFAFIGVLLNGALSGVSNDLRLWLSRVGGVIIVLFGLHLMGLLNIDALNREYKLRIPTTGNLNYLTSFAFGASFAAGWTPCIGAILGSILTLAIASPGTAFWLLVSFSLGLSVPFLLAGLFFSQATHLIERYNARFAGLNRWVGFLLVILGILVSTNSLQLISIFVPLDWLGM